MFAIMNTVPAMPMTGIRGTARHLERTRRLGEAATKHQHVDVRKDVRDKPQHRDNKDKERDGIGGASPLKYANEADMEIVTKRMATAGAP